MDFGRWKAFFLRRNPIPTYENARGYELVAGSDDFTIKASDGHHRVALASIKEIIAYKMDLLTTDLVCWELRVRCGDGEQFWTIHEEAVGFGAVAVLLETLPGFYGRWREAVILPAFEANSTIIYQRYEDLSHLEKPLRTESTVIIDPARPRKKKIVILLATIIATIMLFHVVMDWFAEDRCLDEGGRWHKQSQICEK